MAALDNPYIIRMIGLCKSDWMLILEFAPLGPLKDYLRQYRRCVVHRLYDSTKFIKALTVLCSCYIATFYARLSGVLLYFSFYAALSIWPHYASCQSVCPFVRYGLVTRKQTIRKPCCRKETARCRSCSLRFKVFRQHSLQV